MRLLLKHRIQCQTICILRLLLLLFLLRQFPSNGKRLGILVGGDHKTGNSAEIASLLGHSISLSNTSIGPFSNTFDYLETIAKDMFDNVNVLYHWYAEDCITLDKIPYIGKFSKFMPNVFVGTGYNKWGLTSSHVAANIIVDAILQRENPYTNVFEATRVEPVKNIQEVGNMLKQTTSSLVLKFHPHQFQSNVMSHLEV